MTQGTAEDDDDNGRHLPDGLLPALWENPLRAPHTLALAAVDEFGAEAAEYAQRVRTEHPHASKRELAETVKARYALLARLQGAAAGVPGAVIPVAGAAAVLVPDLVTLAWIQSRMVIHIAAVYGHDPSARQRAEELLELQGIYNVSEGLRTGAAEGGKRVLTRLINKYISGATLQLLKQLFRYVGINFTRTGLLKAVPFVSVPISAVVNETVTKSLGNRAIEYYDTAPRTK